MQWEFLREDEFEGAIKRSGGVCVIPMGCLEKHGEHLPVGTDSITADAIVKEACKLEEVVIFPVTQWLGTVMGSHAVKDPRELKKFGFIGLNPHTLLTVLEELCDEIARNGFSKILIVNAHGGNDSFLDFFKSSQCYNKKNYATMWTDACVFETISPKSLLETVTARKDDFGMITPSDIETLEKWQVEEDYLTIGHSGFSETGLVYGSYPELVEPSRFEVASGISTHRADHLNNKKVRFGYSWPSNYPNHINGLAPVGCTKTIGQAMVKICAERLAGVFKMLKQDEEVLKMVKDGYPC
jgi:creatinine amidohydrolase